MNNRRQFFGQLGAMFAAASAPAILIPSEPIIWKPNVIFCKRTYRTKAIWSPELVQDLQMHYPENAEQKVWELIHAQANIEHKGKEILDVFKSPSPIFVPYDFIPRYHIFATVNERVDAI